MLITLIFRVQELRLLSPPVSCWFVLASPLPLQDRSASSALWLQFCLSEPSMRPDLARAAVCVSAVAGAPRSHAAGMGDKDPILLHCWHIESSLARGSVRGKSNQGLWVCISVSLMIFKGGNRIFVLFPVRRVFFYFASFRFSLPNAT